MRKLIVVIAVLISLSGLATAKGIFIELKGGYFYPSEKAFRDIYGEGMMYGGEATFGIWRNFELWLDGSYFSKKGELTFTKEETKLEMPSIGIGLKYKLSTGSFNFYGGIGLNYFQYKESNPIGRVNKGRLGYVGKIGSFVKVIGGLLIDLYVDYTYCKMEPADYRIDIGGIEAGIGLGYEF